MSRCGLWIGGILLHGFCGIMPCSTAMFLNLRKRVLLGKDAIIDMVYTLNILGIAYLLLAGIVSDLISHPPQVL